jgi:hypothetical protein
MQSPTVRKNEPIRRTPIPAVNINIKLGAAERELQRKNEKLDTLKEKLDAKRNKLQVVYEKTCVSCEMYLISSRFYS